MKCLWNKGVCDPHIHIFKDRAYLYATHDREAENPTFIEDDWWVWSSDNLVDWKLESVLRPEDTYIGGPMNRCWATDAICQNGKYYWVFSDMGNGTGTQQACLGMVESNDPGGPWVDTLHRPLVEARTDVEVYDPAFFQENGEVYLIYGAGQYYIAKMKQDMTGLAEEPRKIVIHDPQGPYGPGTDDKPCAHYYNGKYYLSWGSFYAMGDSIYGPYDYKGCIFTEERTAPAFLKALWPHGIRQGRHGNFFEWHNQWYFTYCDMNGSGNRYFRDTWASYIHYRENGEIAPIFIEECGVGQYFAENAIPAANYFAAENIRKQENEDGTFSVTLTGKDAFLQYPNILHCKEKMKLAIRYHAKTDTPVLVEVSAGGRTESGRIVLSADKTLCTLPVSSSDGKIDSLTLRFPDGGDCTVVTLQME